MFMKPTQFLKTHTKSLLPILTWLFVIIGALGNTVLAETKIPNDDYLTGYIDALLNEKLSIPPDRYTLTVNNGEVLIILEPENEDLRPIILNALQDNNDISSLSVIVPDKPEPAAEGAPIGEFLTNTLGFSSTRLPFPHGDPFRPLIADPKQPKFYVSALNYKTPNERFMAGSVGYGETFGVYRRLGEDSDEGLQISISGGLFALFNLDAPSHDLINADYTIGMPISYRKEDFAVRLRLYHQSSHLGDEYLLRAKPDRVNLSFESLELLFSQDFNKLRGYFGGEALLRKDPADLKPLSFHGGIEYRGTTRFLDAGQIIAGVDVKSWQENNWYPSKSARLGLEIGKPDPSRRHATLMLEWYQGYAPHGQFYSERISNYGAGIYISF
jgi:hypothetical protein